MAAADEQHYFLVSDLIAAAEVVPFLGAGANMCDRPDETPWGTGQFPAERRRARTDARRAQPLSGDATEFDLLRVSQYVGAILGERQLYRYLRAIFDVDYPPNSLHLVPGALPSVLREPAAAAARDHDELRRPGRARVRRARRAYDVVWYEAKGGSQGGKFLHRPSGGEPVVDRAAEQVHGARRSTSAPSSSSCTARRSRRPKGRQLCDHRGRLHRLPVARRHRRADSDDLRERMTDSHFLFLGYSMRDWNLRVILNRIWGAQELDLKSWAVQREPDDPIAREIEETLWSDAGRRRSALRAAAGVRGGARAEIGRRSRCTGDRARSGRRAVVGSAARDTVRRSRSLHRG